MIPTRKTHAVVETADVPPTSIGLTLLPGGVFAATREVKQVTFLSGRVGWPVGLVLMMREGAGEREGAGGESVSVWVLVQVQGLGCM
jgi:hypothetical protein